MRTKRVLLYTIELVKGVERLMPWRTLIEVAKHSPQNMDVAICSAQIPEAVREYEGVKIYSIDYGVEALKIFIKEGNWDLVYYPISYRQGLKDMCELASIKVRKVAYVPGGICPLSGSLKLIMMGELKCALPYLLDTITPHSLIANKMQKCGFEAIVCQSYYTANDALQSGWKNVVCALPGNDSMIDKSLDSTPYANLELAGQKYILFCGSPSPIRGAILALEAFDKVATNIPDTKMVMLMRKDVSSDFSEFNKAVSKIKNKDRFIISYKKYCYEELLCFYKFAWAVVLPFIVIPSEIPLTFLEVMGLGTPVVCFENGGTTQYLRKGLKIIKYRYKHFFSKSIIEICNNVSEREMLSQSAKEIMLTHPTWEESSKIWLNVL